MSRCEGSVMVKCHSKGSTAVRGGRTLVAVPSPEVLVGVVDPLARRDKIH